MKRAWSFLLLFTSLVFVSCEKEQTPIQYPENGLSGPNILAANRVNYPETVSLEADLGEANQLLVVIKGVTSYTRRDTVGQMANGSYNIHTSYRGAWFWTAGRQHNVLVDQMNFEGSFSQRAQSVDATGKVTAQLKFDPGYAYILEIYENNAAQPTRVKQIQVE